MDWKDQFPKENRYFETNNGILFCGDMSEILPRVLDESVDLIVTDPPYLKKYLYTYEYLANLCPRIMKRGASLVTIVGHYAIPQVIKIFDGKLKYRWLFVMNQETGKHARMAMGIEILYKPILWYVKEAYPNGHGFIKDMFRIEEKDGQEKTKYKWQQSKQWAEFFLKKLIFTDKDIVLDPYIGSGTIAVVSERFGMRWIGIEIDEKLCKITVDRIKSIDK